MRDKINSWILVWQNSFPGLCAEYLSASCRCGCFFPLHPFRPRHPPLLSVCSDQFPMILHTTVLLLLLWPLSWRLLRNNNTGCYHNRPATLRLLPLSVILGWTWPRYGSLFVRTHRGLWAPAVETQSPAGELKHNFQHFHLLDYRALQLPGAVVINTLFMTKRTITPLCKERLIKVMRCARAQVRIYTLAQT